MAMKFKACCVEGCNNCASQERGGRRGLCSSHYWRWKRSRQGLKRCSVGGCSTSSTTKGMCSMHYHRFRTFGDPMKGRTPNGAPQRYFDEVVLVYGGDECLMWPYAKDNQGYARMFDGKRMKSVSRMACEKANGEAPDGKPHAAHACGNGHLGCVSKVHIRWASVSDNMNDKVKHGTSNRGIRCASAKLSEQDVKDIRSSKGIHSQYVIAHKYGINQSTVSDIMTGKLWAWLP